MLAITNADLRDDSITFQDYGHIYTLTDIKGNKINPISTTTLIHSFFPHFDADAIIDKMFKSGSAQRNYPGMSKSDIKASWKSNGKEAADFGTKMHLDIERYLNSETVLNDTTEYNFFLKFWDDFIAYQWMFFDE